MSPVRPSFIALAGLAGAVAALGATFVDAGLRSAAAGPGLAARGALAARLELTDLALFTEARYTRNPSQADLHAAFQDHPFAFEHFPTGSLVAPAAAKRGRP
ncbi:hypothetical protein [Magnetospirillum sp. UT-4]|uniref:hypothetical protein n=1 Tax=Magnetospirillum sp. UT-4 TaxID=2681467 RepID=UPI0013864556|nr:hypothetical protein [Magnetospirillum sp. UT-4]CAA7622772.1 conserved exported hypothetical protein [Magnetospirillum sp. UT-4]